MKTFLAMLMMVPVLASAATGYLVDVRPMQPLWITSPPPTYTTASGTIVAPTGGISQYLCVYQTNDGQQRVVQRMSCPQKIELKD